MYSGCPIHSTAASNMDTSITAPSPVRSRRNSAPSTDTAAYRPAAMSAVGTPVLVAVSGVPVTATIPDSACTSMS